MEFNNAPYHDDFDEDKNHYSVLFKAGYDVQARELNVLQSMKQFQIGSLGNHLFKNGAKISGCSNSFIQYDYVRINDIENKIKSFNNTIFKLVGLTSKVEATIIEAYEQSQDDDALILVMYTKTGDNQESVFLPGESIEIYKDNILQYTVSVKLPDSQPTDASVPVTGKSLLFVMDEGVFFYNNYFVRVHKQSLLVERYLNKDENGNIISDDAYRIGFDIVEDIITADEDKSLLDPHFGAPNFGAPGADRYKISLYLSIRDYVDDGTTTNFILIAKVRQNHTVEYKKDDTEYNEIMKEIARRTYETYGDFTLVPWKAHFLNEKKSFETDTTGWSLNGDPNKYVAIVSPGTGYIKGHRIATQSDIVVRGRLAKDVGTLSNLSTNINEPKSVIVTSNTVVDWGVDSNFKATLHNSNDVIVGTLNIYDIYKLSDTQYKVFFYNVVRNGNAKLESAVKIKLQNGSFIGTCPINSFTNAISYESSLLIPTGLKNIVGISNVRMKVRSKFSAILDSSGSYTFNAQGDSTFVQDNYAIAWVNNSGTKSNIALSNINITNDTISVSLGASYAGATFTLITTVNKVNIPNRTKTKTLKDESINGGPAVSKAGWSYKLKYDVIKLESVTISFGDGTPEIDITKEYSLEKNKGDNYYGESIIRRNTYRNINPDDVIKITYSYFLHSAEGEYFNINSYNEDDLSEIPLYNGLNASDYFDFRTDATDINKSYFKNIPVCNTSITFDAQYYMSRTDLLLVNTKGDFYIKEGIPSRTTKIPKVDEDSLAICAIFLESMGTAEDIKIQFYDNKSYQSKELNRVAERINKIEDAVTLSMLEMQTVNMSIKDINGMDRYKNGFLVDNFKSFSASDINHAEYNAAIDTKNGELRPQFRQSNIKMLIDSAKTVNMKIKNGMAIKEYSDDLFIQNPYATQSVSINPYFIFCNTGKVVLSPNIDTWADDTHLPNVSTTIDTGVEALTKVADAAKLLGTNYGSWTDLNTSIVQSTNTADKVNSTTAQKVLNSGTDGKTVQDVKTTTTITTTEKIKSTTVNSQRDVKSAVIKSSMKAYTIEDMVKDVSFVPYIRSKTVQFYASKLKPNTQVYAYFDGINITQYCRPIAQIDPKSDNVLVNRNASMFGTATLVSDKDGNLVGEFRIPAATFFVGEKTFVLTNDPQNTGNPDVETTRCETSYFAGGVSQTKQTSTLNVVTPTYSSTSDKENKSTTSVSRDVTTSTKTVTTESEAYFIEREYTINEVKEYFEANHPLLSNNCKIKSINPHFGGITWGGSASSSIQSDFNYAKILAIKERVEDIEILINQFDSARRIQADWFNYSNLPPKEAFARIKGAFEKENASCKIAGDRWYNSIEYQSYLKEYSKEKEETLIARNKNAGWTRVNWNGGWFRAINDPVAQGFKVDDSCFISKVDVFFEFVDDKSEMIWFEIRELVNGYPAGPSEAIGRVEISGADLKKYEDKTGNTSYPVEFEVPLYVDASKSYAFIVGGYSPETRLFMSKLGAKLINSTSILEQPPLPYTMFRSLNGETWNAEQFDTMKINIYRCVFDMSPSSISFYTDSHDTTNLKCQFQPIEIQKGSNKVRIYANNHNLRTNDRVTLNFNSGLYFQIEVTNGGIPQIGQPISTLTGSGYIHDVKSTPSLNVYAVNVEKMVGVFKKGQEFTCQTRNYEYRDLVSASASGVPAGVPIVQNIVLGNVKNISDELEIDLAGASLELFAKEHIVRAVDTIDSFIIEVESPFTSSGRFGGENIYIHGNNIKVDVFNVSGQYLAYNSKEVWNAVTHSFDDTVIPDVPFLPMHDVELSNPSVVLSNRNESRVMGKGNSSFNVVASFTPINPYLSPVINTDSFSVTAISNRIDFITDTVYNVEPNAKDRYISETDASRGAQPYKHITNKVLLENPAHDMRVIFDVHLPSQTDFEVYVKVSKPGETAAEKDLSWIKIDNYTKKNTSNNKGDYITYDLTLSKNCTVWTGNIEYITYRVKLVGKSKNSSLPVIFKNLRAIAVT